MQPIFITGIGTGIGKTIISAIVTEALEADYWKPVQAGFADGTDALQIQSLISNPNTTIHTEVYKLALPASPHIAARDENITINLDEICNRFSQLQTENSKLKTVVIEGAGGLLVPLNDNEFVIDLIKKLNARVLLVSRNYLGSINHSLLTAEVCKAHNLNVIGWIFNDQYMHYEEEIVRWSGFPAKGSVSFAPAVTKAFIKAEAEKIKTALLQSL